MSSKVPAIGDFGFDLIYTAVDSTGTAVDISLATAKVFNIRKPDGTIVPKVALFVTDGTDGILKYTVETGLLDLAGTYVIEIVISGASFTKTSLDASFEVGIILN